MRMTARRLGPPFPYWRRVKLPADRALDRALEAIFGAVRNFIDQARVRMEERPELVEAPENLLEGMLAAQRTGEGFTDQDIAGNVVTVLLAGEDTTSHTIGWTVWLLGSRPVQSACAPRLRRPLATAPLGKDDLRDDGTRRHETDPAPAPGRPHRRGPQRDFYPERWLEDSEETRAPKSLSFGAGPRFCPGRNLAFLEARAALGMIARDFELELDQNAGV